MKNNQNHSKPFLKIHTILYNFTKEKRFRSYVSKTHKIGFILLFLFFSIGQVDAQIITCDFTPTFPPPSVPPPSPFFGEDYTCSKKEMYNLKPSGGCISGRRNCDNEKLFCASITLDIENLEKPDCPSAKLQSNIRNSICDELEITNNSSGNFTIYFNNKCKETNGPINLGNPSGRFIKFIVCSSSRNQYFNRFSWKCPPEPPACDKQIEDCDDNNCLTEDILTDDCNCVNIPISPPICDPHCEVYDTDICQCVSIIKPGTPCNDGLACTTNDQYDENCECHGERIGIPGDVCDDGDECTIDDTLNDDCQCVGVPGPDSDKDGILDCEDDCPFDIDSMVDGDIKCGVAIRSNNFLGQSLISNYGDCTSNSMAMGRELVYRLNNTSQSDIVITFKESGNIQLRRLNLLIVTDPCTPESCLADYAINAPLLHGQNSEEIVLKDAAPGIYYIIVDGNMPTATNDFTLLVECTGGSAVSCPDDAHYFESFESYTVGKGIVVQDEVHWSIQGNSANSALITKERSSNYDQSLQFNRFNGGIQDINLNLGEKYTGAYRISWDMYIYPMGAAHFGLFGGDNSDPWGTIGHTFRMFATKYQGKWFNVEMYLDLDKNKYILYMNNRHFEESGKYYLNLHHINFYSPPGGDFYIDNICYAEVESIPNANSSDDRLIEQQFTEDLTVFPNPAKEEVLIDLSGYTGKEIDLVIHDAMSVEVYRKHISEVDKEKQRISLENFTNGLYIINVKGKGVRTKAKKLIVSRLY